MLTYAVALPEGADDSRMDDETMERVRAVLERRLAQLDLGAGGGVVLGRSGGGHRDPARGRTRRRRGGIPCPARPASFTDADGKAWLTGADVSAAEAGLSASAEGEEAQTAYILLTLTDEGRQAYAEAQAALDAREDGSSRMSAVLDGATIAQAAPGKQEGGDLLLTGDFTGGRGEAARRPHHGGRAARCAYADGRTQPARCAGGAVLPRYRGPLGGRRAGTRSSWGCSTAWTGKCCPDNPVKRSEAIVILNRTLGASVQDATAGLKNVPQNARYAADLGKAIHLGLIGADDSRNFDAAATRAEAFVRARPRVCL